MSADADTQTLDEKYLEFAETSIETVRELRKQAKLDQDRIAELESELATAREQASQHEKRASAAEQREVFAADELDTLAQALFASGLIDVEVDQIKQAFTQDPTQVLITFRNILGADAAGELTTLKAASETRPDLWQLAAADR